MSQEVRLVIEHREVTRNLLWISLQDDGGISIGFLDQPLVVQGFTSERELEDGMQEIQHTDLRKTHKPEAPSCVRGRARDRFERPRHSLTHMTADLHRHGLTHTRPAHVGLRHCRNGGPPRFLA
jgi:hypothetical protein